MVQHHQHVVVAPLQQVAAAGFVAPGSVQRGRGRRSHSTRIKNKNKEQQVTNKKVSEPQNSNDKQQQQRHTTTTTRNNTFLLLLPVGVVGVAVGHDVVGAAVADFQTQLHQSRLQPGHDRHSLLHGTASEEVVGRKKLSERCQEKEVSASGQEE